MFGKISTIEALNTMSFKTLSKALRSNDSSVRRIAEGRFLLTFINNHLNKYSNAVLGMDAAKMRLMEVVESNEFEPMIWNDYISLETDLLKLVGDIRSFATAPIKILDYANLVAVLRDTIHALKNLITRYSELATEEMSREPDSDYKDEISRKIGKVHADMGAHLELCNLIDHSIDLLHSKESFVATPKSEIMLTTEAYNRINSL